MTTLPNPHALLATINECASEGIDGHRSASEVYAMAKVLMNGLERLMKDDIFKGCVLHEVEKWGKEGYSKYGLTLTKKAGAGTNDFSRTQAILDRLEEVEQMKKIAKALPYDSEPSVFPKTGELVYPAIYIGGAETINASKAKEEL